MLFPNINMKAYWDVIEQIVKESDVVLEILDARMIQVSRNAELEKIIKRLKRPVILVINKTDLVSAKNLEESIEKLNRDEKNKGKEIVFVSCMKKSTVRNLLSRIKKVFEKHGKRKGIEYSTKRTTYREAKADIVVGVVGYPNVGKSSIINALSFKKKAKVTSRAGTTHGSHWITAGDQIKLIDTPGVIPLEYMDKTKLDMIGARRVDKIKDREVVAAKIIDLFLENNKQKFEKKYNIKIEDKEDAYQIIERLGKLKGHLKKGGVVDEPRTSTMIIMDWQKGNLKL